MARAVINKSFVDWDEFTELKQFQINVAKQTLAEEQAKGSFPEVGYITIVDNKAYKPIERVSPFGKIEYRSFVPLFAIAKDAIQRLLKESPRGRGASANRSGRYLENHIVMVNNTPINSSGRGINYIELEKQLELLQAGGGSPTIRIVNIQPYARKIEKGLSPQAGRGVYNKVFSWLRRKYGNFAFITRQTVAASRIPGLKALVAKNNNWQASNANLYGDPRYPSIRIRPGRGTL